MSEEAVKTLADIAKYQLRFGEFPKVWYISMSERDALLQCKEYGGDLALEHGKGCKTRLMVRDLGRIFPWARIRKC